MQDWEFAHRFSERIANFFCEKMSKWAIRSKNKWITHLLIFGERPERIAHGRLFLVSDLSDLLTSLIFGERSERFAHIAHKKWGNEQIAHFLQKKRILNILNNNVLDVFSQKFLRESLIRSFIMSNLSESLTVAHLSWVTWAICSRWLIFLERAERFAHSRSFVLSNLSESLTVAHLIWAKWANEQMSDEWMSEFPALLICQLYEGWEFALLTFHPSLFRSNRAF